MSTLKPFTPTGTCSTCRFSEPIPEKHFLRNIYYLFCRRFPPNLHDGTMSIPTPVSTTCYCAEWEIH